MRKVKAFLTLMISIIILASCSPYYREGEFFPNDFLKEQLIENLPIPEGDFLYKSAYGFHCPCVYVNSDVDAEIYAQQVLDYLKSQNFKFIYTVDSIYVSIDLVSKEDSYKVKEFTTLDECYYNEFSEDSWFFIFGNNEETYTNDEGTIFLKDEHMIRIYNKSGRLEDHENSINFKYDWEIIINDNPCNVTYIGN